MTEAWAWHTSILAPGGRLAPPIRHLLNIPHLTSARGRSVLALAQQRLTPLLSTLARGRGMAVQAFLPGGPLALKPVSGRWRSPHLLGHCALLIFILRHVRHFAGCIHGLALTTNGDVMVVSLTKPYPAHLVKDMAVDSRRQVASSGLWPDGRRRWARDSLTTAGHYASPFCAPRSPFGRTATPSPYLHLPGYRRSADSPTPLLGERLSHLPHSSQCSPTRTPTTKLHRACTQPHRRLPPRAHYRTTTATGKLYWTWHTFTFSVPYIYLPFSVRSNRLLRRLLTFRYLYNTSPSLPPRPPARHSSPGCAAPCAAPLFTCYYHCCGGRRTSGRTPMPLLGGVFFRRLCYCLHGQQTPPRCLNRWERTRVDEAPHYLLPPYRLVQFRPVRPQCHRYGGMFRHPYLSAWLAPLPSQLFVMTELPPPPARATTPPAIPQRTTTIAPLAPSLTYAPAVHPGGPWASYTISHHGRQTV